MSTTYLIPKNFLNEIENFVTANKKKFSSIRFRKYASTEFKEWVEKRNIPTKFFGYIHKKHLTKITIPTCPTCGKELSFKQIMNGSTFCSIRCSNLSKETQEKMKQTCFKNFGVKHPLHSKKIQEQVKQTCLEKYGVVHPSQSKEIKEKKKQTTLKHYGAKNPFQSEEIKEKIKDSHFQKYGVKNPSQRKEIKEKIKKIHRLNHWETFCSLLKEKNIVPLFSKKEYILKTERKFKCLSCGEEFISDGTCNYLKEHKNKDGTYTTLNVYHIYCPYCSKAHYSKKEKEVLKFVKTIYNGEVLENHKGLFPNKQMELDIYLPALNLGIEFDGEYWHSSENATERDEKKNQLCEQKGIKLLRIKEKDWDNNREGIKKQIEEFLNLK